METTMLRRLRLKFVALNMATVAVVLAVVFTAICVINYQQGTNGVYSALDAAIDHAGDAAKMPPVDGILGPQGATGGSAFSGMTPPEIGGRRAEGESVIPVVVYALEDDGGMAVVPSSTTASIADDVLSDAASAVLQKGEGPGFLDAFGLFYSKRDVGGTTFVAFADASAVSSWRSLALTLAAVGVGALAVFLVISVFFSRWALGPVARAWDQQQRFVADASHELKTPLTVILANTSILRAHPERSVASQSQWIESTQSEAERMQELVRDMLDLARPEHAETVREHARVDLTDLVEGGLLQFESVAFERNVSLASDIDRDVSVTGDASRLRRLVTTLLDNACKYVEEGGRIAVTLRQTARPAACLRPLLPRRQGPHPLRGKLRPGACHRARNRRRAWGEHRRRQRRDQRHHLHRRAAPSVFLSLSPSEPVSFRACNPRISVIFCNFIRGLPPA